MIDDAETVTQLLERMEAHLPIPALPTSQLVRTLRGRSVKLRADRAVFVQRVFYLGDEGGMACDVTPSGVEKEAFVVALTHLRLGDGHPLSGEIRAYQREWVKRIAESQR